MSSKYRILCYRTLRTPWLQNVWCPDTSPIWYPFEELNCAKDVLILGGVCWQGQLGYVCSKSHLAVTFILIFMESWKLLIIALSTWTTILTSIFYLKNMQHNIYKSLSIHFNIKLVDLEGRPFLARPLPRKNLNTLHFPVSQMKNHHENSGNHPKLTVIYGKNTPHLAISLGSFWLEQQRPPRLSNEWTTGKRRYTPNSMIVCYMMLHDATYHPNIPEPRKSNDHG